MNRDTVPAWAKREDPPIFHTPKGNVLHVNCKCADCTIGKPEATVTQAGMFGDNKAGEIAVTIRPYRELPGDIREELERAE
jgi:hypothetical protein